jgi:hypothetical protein
MNDVFTIARGATVLADGLPAGTIVTEGPMVNGRRLLDVEPFIFGDSTVIYDRGGDVEEVRFTVATAHATKAGSLDHALRHGRSVRGVADLVMAYTEEGSTRIWKARGAGWEGTEIAPPEGYATAVRYRVLCPKIEPPVTIGGEGLPGSVLTGDVDGGDADLGATYTRSVNCRSEGDDAGSVVSIYDGGEVAA